MLPRGMRDQVVVVDKLTIAAIWTACRRCTNDPRFEFVSADIRTYAAIEGHAGYRLCGPFRAENPVDRSWPVWRPRSSSFAYRRKERLRCYAAHEAGVKPVPPLFHR